MRETCIATEHTEATESDHEGVWFVGLGKKANQFSKLSA